MSGIFRPDVRVATNTTIGCRLAAVTDQRRGATSFAARISDARRALPHANGKEVTQAEIAARAGWSQQRYSKIESGSQKTLSVEDIYVLAAALDEDPYYLFTGLRAQLVGDLAARIDRLELDSWGEDAIWDTAQREAKRYQQQREAEAMKRAGLSDEEAEVLRLYREASVAAKRLTLAGLQSDTAHTQEERSTRQAS